MNAPVRKPRPSWDEIRSTRTKTEKLVERLLREHYPELEFATNQQILGYLPDFHFPKQRVLLEIDGPIHDGYHAELKDWRKDQKLVAAGYQVVRLRNADIWNDPTAAAHVIGSTLGILRDGIDQEEVWERFSRAPAPEGQTRMRLTVRIGDRQLEVDAIEAPIGRGCFLLHRHPENASLWCLTHRDSGVIVGTSWRYRTLADAAVRMWRTIPRRERDVLRGRAQRPPSQVPTEQLFS